MNLFANSSEIQYFSILLLVSHIYKPWSACMYAPARTVARVRARTQNISAINKEREKHSSL